MTMKLARKKKANADQESVKNLFDGDISLNQTSDFAGGCSQYKSVVQHVQTRGIINKFSKNSSNKRGSSSTSLVGTQVASPKKEESEKNLQNYSSTDNDKKPSKCRLCQIDVPEDELQQHTGLCLHHRFGRSAKQSEAEENVPTQCEICLIDLNDLDSAARLNHINACIDEKMASMASAKGDQVLEECHLCGKKMPHLSPFFRSLHITRCADKIKCENDQLKAKEAVKTRKQSKVLDCPLCGQKLRTRASRKTHLKKCGQKFDIPPNIVMERVREQEEQQKLELENNSLSGKKPLEKQKKPRSRNAGAPSSSSVVPVQSAQFIDDQIQLAMALSRSLHEEQRKFGRISDEPSKSLTSTSATKESVISANPTVRNVNQEKDVFSILMTPNKKLPAVKKRGKRKERDDSMPEMLAISKEELARKIADKMAAMILPQENDDHPSSTPEMAATELPEKYQALVPNSINSREFKDQEMVLTSNQWSAPFSRPLNFDINESVPQPQKRVICFQTGVVMSLWSCSALNDRKQCEGYYVKELMPPISPCKIIPGSKLKSLASIPGRGLDDSVLAPGKKSPKEAPVKTPKVRDKVLNETLIPSTQTAVVLAELADGDVTLAPDSGPSAAEASGFLMEEMINQEPKQAPSTKTSLDTLAADFSCMVNNQLCSDLIIKTRKSTTLHAHKFVLAARSPKFYREVSKVKELDLEEFSQDSVLSVIGFLYSGQLNLSKSFIPEVRALAQRWQILDFATILDSLKSTLKSENGDALNDSWDEADKTQDHDLNELLRQVWGSDEEDEAEDSDSSGDEDEETGGGAASNLESQDDLEVDEIMDDANLNCSRVEEMSPLKKLSQMSDNEIVNILSPEMANNESNSEVESQESDNDVAENILNPKDGQDEDVLSDMEVEADDASQNDSSDNEKIGDPEKQSDNCSIPEGDQVCPDSELSGNADELESAFIDLRNSDDDKSDTETLISGNGKDEDHVNELYLSECDQSNEGNEKATAHHLTISTPSGAERSVEDGTPDLFGESFTAQKNHPSSSDTPVGITSQKNKDRPSPFEITLFDSDEEEAVQELDKTTEYPMQPEREHSEESNDVISNDGDDSGCPNSMFYQKLDDTFSTSPVFSSQRSQEKVTPQTAKVNLSLKFESKVDSSPVIPSTEDEHKKNESGAEVDDKTSSTLSQKRKRVTSDQGNSSFVSPASPGPCSSPVFKSRKVCTCTPKRLMKRTMLQEENVAPIDLTMSDNEDEPVGDKMDVSQDDPSSINEADEDNDSSTTVTKMSDGSGQTNEDDAQGVKAQVEDIWEDFDDDGGFLELEIPEQFNTPARGVGPEPKTPQITPVAAALTKMKSPAKITSISSPRVLNMKETLEANEHHVLSPSPAKGAVSRTAPDDEYDPPTDMDTDVSALLNDSAIWDDRNEPEVPQIDNKLETPANSKPRRSDRGGALPSPFTPMPNYESMKTPVLKDECKKFGIKQQPKKKMVKSLKHIYHELHHYETDSDHCDLEEDEGQRHGPTISRSARLPSSSRCIAVDEAAQASDSSCDSDEDNNHIGKLMETFVDGSSSKESGSEQGSPVKGAGRGRRGGKSKAPVRKRPPKLDTAELKEKLREYIQADDQLNLKILYYEPLMFDEFSAMLKQNAIHAKDNVIVQCLDELNIQFTTKSDDGKSKWRKGKKRASPRK